MANNVEVPQTFIDELYSVGIDLYLDDIMTTLSITVAYPFVMTLKVRKGYLIKSTSGKYDVINDEYESFSIAPDELSATRTFNTTNTFSPNSWNFTTDVIDIAVKGYNDVYLIDDDSVSEVINDAYGVYYGSAINGGVQYKDYRQFIIGLLRLPFKIPDEMIIGVRKGQLGDMSTRIDGTAIDGDVLRVNMGSITIPLERENLTDYKRTRVVLHLPMANSIVLDTSLTVGHVVSIEYIINLYDGVCLINVKSSHTDSIIESVNVDLNVSIPFSDEQTNPTDNKPHDVQLGIINDVKTPFINVIRNDSVLIDGFFTTPIVDENVLLGNSGFIQVENINLKTTAKGGEKREILTRLTSGFIIN